MEWNSLLTNTRFGQPERTHNDPIRTAFEMDYDRIVFSSAFRRLQDKTQVFPLANTDYVRTRLTHSIEVSVVGRNLTRKVVSDLNNQKLIDQDEYGVLSENAHMVVAAACLCHDIGNPPFGHAGESAIRKWFVEYLKESHNNVSSDLSIAERLDFTMFEGNAQGFRLLTRLLSNQHAGGLHLTCATLSAFVKYPNTSDVIDNELIKKHGICKDDIESMNTIAETAGTINGDMWRKHPLVYLMEAADDICYQVVDIEDAARVGAIPYRDAIDALIESLSEDTRNNVEAKIAEYSTDEKEQIAYIRAMLIGDMIVDASSNYVKNYTEIMRGSYDGKLLSPNYDELREVTKQVYKNERVLFVEKTGETVLAGLLSVFVEAQLSGESSEQKYQGLLPRQYRIEANNSTYKKLLAVTDHVSGMTDAYALKTYQKLFGIRVV